MRQRLSLLMSILFFAAATLHAGTPPVPQLSSDPAFRPVDSIDYDTEKARSLWHPMEGTPPVSVIRFREKRILKLDVPFKGTDIERASWDLQRPVDMTLCKGLELIFYVEDVSNVSHFTVYFHSKGGWYRAPFFPAETGKWTGVKIYKEETDREGEPGGWASVDRIRLSAWRGKDTDSALYLAGIRLFGTDSSLLILHQENKTGPYTKTIETFLKKNGITTFVCSPRQLTQKVLENIDVLILPHNPGLGVDTVEKIAAYLRSGGKLLACYTLPEALGKITGITTGDHLKEKHEGQFASIRSSDEPLDHAPVTTRQHSWNIREAFPQKEKSRIAAWWYDQKGTSTEKAAIVAGKNCVFLTHVLLDSDPEAKARLLLSMAGHLSPGLWKKAAAFHINRVFHTGSPQCPDAVEQSLKEQAEKRAGQGEPEALALCNKVKVLLKKSRLLLVQKKYAEAIDSADRAHKVFKEAFCRAQTSSHPEHRAFWCHSAFGVKDMSWDAAIKNLADNGFTSILPNMLWGGVAFYKSAVLPTADEVAEKGDQIELCLKACKKYGIACHVWKVNYNMGWRTTPEFMEKMQKAGRTQVAFDGSPDKRWLCPSHPENQKLEIDSMLEIVRNYPVDGIHFDYIRYPGRDHCFCSGCRRRFEKAINRTIENWPAAIRSDAALQEKWNEFRRKQITNVVKTVSEKARTIRKDIKISAAVFRNWPRDRDTVAQNWKLWCEKGYLDFVCPMDYTASNRQFEVMIDDQLKWAGGVPCYPGIGLSVWSDPRDIFKLIEQIRITRKLKTGGFTIFNYGVSEASHMVPQLGSGVTRNRRK